MTGIKLKELLNETKKSKLTEVMDSYKALEGATVKHTRIVKRKGSFDGAAVVITSDNGLKLEFDNTGNASITK